MMQEHQQQEDEQMESLEFSAKVFTERSHAVGVDWNYIYKIPTTSVTKISVICIW